MAKLTEQDRLIYLQRTVDNMQNELDANPDLFEKVYHGSEVELTLEVKNRINDLIAMHKEAYKRESIISKFKYRFFPGS